MTQTLEERMKIQSKCIKIPEKIRPFDVGYRVVNKHGQPLALKNGASIFALPSLAEKAIRKSLEKMIQTLTPESTLSKRSLLSI